MTKLIDNWQYAETIKKYYFNFKILGYKNFAALEKLAAEHNLSSDLVAHIRAIAEKGGDPRACHWLE